MLRQSIIRCWFSLLILIIFPGICLADGIVVIEPPVRPHPVPVHYLDIKYHHVDIDIQNQYVTTKVDQVFVNSTSRDLEGTYLFPLPEEATISDFSMPG